MKMQYYVRDVLNNAIIIFIILKYLDSCTDTINRFNNLDWDIIFILTSSSFPSTFQNEFEYETIRGLNFKLFENYY